MAAHIQQGLSMPRAHIADGFYQWMIVLLIGLVVANFCGSVVLRNRTQLVRDVPDSERIQPDGRRRDHWLVYSPNFWVGGEHF